jgi:hypothetical protein
MSPVQRRALLAAIAVYGLTGRSAGYAAAECTPFAANGLQLCEAGLEITVPDARQLHPHWCWAACAEAIFSAHGFRMRQEDFVAKVFGATPDWPANVGQIVSAINGDWTDDRGRRFSADAEIIWDSQRFRNPDAAATAAHELVRGNPLINGAARHATVLVGMRYLRDQNGRGWPMQLIVHDPWPGLPNRRLLVEAADTGFLVRVGIAG